MGRAKDCLILAMPQDIHSYAVGWALNKLGVVSRYFYTSDLPDRAAVRFEGDGKAPFSLSFQCASGWDSPSDIWCAPRDFHSAWFRRSRKPTLRPDLGEGDRQIADADWYSVTQSVELVLEREIGFCLNPPSTRVGRHLKCYHLWLAESLGLETPGSLITNDADAIHRFVEDRTNAGSRCIAKPMHLPAWEGRGEASHAFTTSLITPSDLLGVDIISDPVILQPEIEKSFEVRVTKIGHEYVAVTINSQDTAEGKLDFRLNKDWSEFGHEAIDIPINILSPLKKLCDALGLIFCTCDFIVDRTGKWVFLEINHMGNWLWIEMYNPKIKLLSRFAQMLAIGKSDYLFDESVDISIVHFIEEYEKEKYKIAEREAEVHAINFEGSPVVDR